MELKVKVKETTDGKCFYYMLGTRIEDDRFVNCFKKIRIYFIEGQKPEANSIIKVTNGWFSFSRIDIEGEERTYDMLKLNIRAYELLEKGDGYKIVVKPYKQKEEKKPIQKEQPISNSGIFSGANNYVPF